MSILRANGSFEILKFIKNVNSNVLDQAKNENVLLRQCETKYCQQIYEIK